MIYCYFEEEDAEGVDFGGFVFRFGDYVNLSGVIYYEEHEPISCARPGSFRKSQDAIGRQGRLYGFGRHG